MGKAAKAVQGAEFISTSSASPPPPLPRPRGCTPMSAAAPPLPHLGAAGHLRQRGFEPVAQSEVFLAEICELFYACEDCPLASNDPPNGGGEKEGPRAAEAQSIF